MTEIEKIERYIARTRIANRERYYLNLIEAIEMADAISVEDRVTVADIISLAFNYGRAKGYRAAKAEVRK